MTLNKLSLQMTGNVLVLALSSWYMYALGFSFNLMIASKWGSVVLEYFDALRISLIENIGYYFLSPVYELILGVTLGVDLLNSLPRFNDVYIELGLIHVLVVSRYNINLVINLITQLLPKKLNFFVIFTAIFIALNYSFLVGLSAPVIRALVMSSVYILLSASGYYQHPFKILFYSFIFVLGYDPLMVGSLSLQLSFLASFGLISMYNVVYNQLANRLTFIPDLFKIDLAATLSAQIFTAPLIFFHFGRFSIASIFSNMLLLFFIPIITILSLYTLIISLIDEILYKYMSYVLFNISQMFIQCSDLMFILVSDLL